MATTNGAALNGGLVQTSKLTKKRRRELLQGPTGTAFDMYTRLFASFADGDVFETGEWRARDMDEMLERDGDAMMIEQALTLPPQSTTYSLNPAKGDSGELELVQKQLYTPSYSGGLTPSIDLVIAQMCGAAIYRKAFFEKKWDIIDGVTTLTDLAWRPASTCEVRRDEHTAAFDGFRQRAWWFSIKPSGKKAQTGGGGPGKNWDGYYRIPRIRAFVHIHGQHRAPLVGTSDMDVTYWAYKQKQKLLFLWFQFLECQSLPKIAAYGSDPDQAEDNASALASMKASGVAGFERPPSGQSLFDVIESSGQGAQQFQNALQFLSSFSSKSIMAGFLELGNAAALGRGSYALSESQSQFFLQAREASVKEMCANFTSDVCAPIAILNKGPDAAVPTLSYAPLTQSDSQQIITTLTTLAAAPQLRVPDEYVLLVAQKAADVMNLPAGKVSEIIDKAAKQAQQMAAQNPMGATPVGQGAAKIAGATQAASQLIRQQTQGGASGRNANAGATSPAATAAKPG